MKILLVNKFLYPKGGAETYVLKLGRILQERGCEVQYFGSENEKNTVGNAIGAYVSAVDFGAGLLRNWDAPFRILYSTEARRKIRRVLEDFQPDVVHLNNIQFHLTPSVILEVHRYRTQTHRKVNIIYTAHDYQLICPSHGLFDSHYRICEKCLGGQYMHCLKTKCLKNSRIKSLLGTLDGYLWKWSPAYGYIDRIICCSTFLKSKLDTQPRFRERTLTLPNFSDAVPERIVEKGDYVLQFGHLSRDKGTHTLLEAARRMPEVRFVFAGYGEAEDAIRQLPNGEYVGFLSGEKLELLIRRAKLSVYPSQWYENCPFSVIESQMYGTPVVASRIGGIPELIRDGESGELFEPGNVGELTEKIRKVLSRGSWYADNCKHQRFETPDSYYKKLMEIYGADYENL